MRKMSSVCDYFVIASGTSTTHVRALSDNIVKELKLRGQPVSHVEGEREASWILLDFVDVVCHLFLEDTRAFYDLEGLWKKAAQEHFEEARPIKLPPRRKTAKRAASKKRPAKKSAKRTKKKRSKK
jgi:ribosome-associated protein